jgi:CBS domain-containing protein
MDTSAMDNQKKSDCLPYIASLPVFATLPAKTLDHLCRQIRRKTIKAGHTLSVQNKTVVDKVYVIESGSLELFFEKDGRKTLRGTMGPGDIFGGISILMNSSISVRTVAADEDTSLLYFSRELFLDLCTGSGSFYTYFVQTFHTRMIDESYSSLSESFPVSGLLAETPPFSLLPVHEREKIVANLTEVYYSKGTILFFQDKSRVEYLYIVDKGALERYWEENGQEKMFGVLGRGDTYGGISMLFNNGTAVRTARVAENTHFYILPREAFLSLCDKYPPFSDHFTNTFGRLMLDRSYASIIRQGPTPKVESPPLFSLRVEDVYHTDLLSCQGDISIQAAAVKMSRQNYSSIFVNAPGGEPIGIVTDNDIRRKVVATGYDIQKPVADIMSSPLTTIPAGAMLAEALLEMMRSDIKHLLVLDAGNKVAGVITNSDILSTQEQSPFFMLREISTATGLKQLIKLRRRIPNIIRSMIDSGAKSTTITKLITSISDAILAKLIGFALEKHGPAPAAFAFLILGSEGRMEQTLKTDQDNAILYADVDETASSSAQLYFLALGETICNWLDEVGYAFCKGGIMAKNPRWCQPISKWKHDFHSWIRISTRKDLMQSAIFFDFRGAYGSMDLVDDLRLYLFHNLKGWTRFFKELTENALGFRPPLSFFNNFVVETKGRHRNQFNIKNAMTCVVDFARIYALHYDIADTNTQDRLYRLFLEKVLKPDEYQDLEQAYDFLMQHRLLAQINSIEAGEPPDNYINPKELSKIEQALFRTIFKRIERMQTNMKMKFTGSV